MFWTHCARYDVVRSSSRWISPRQYARCHWWWYETGEFPNFNNNHKRPANVNIGMDYILWVCPRGRPCGKGVRHVLLMRDPPRRKRMSPVAVIRWIWWDNIFGSARASNNQRTSSVGTTLLDVKEETTRWEMRLWKARPYAREGWFYITKKHQQ